VAQYKLFVFQARASCRRLQRVFILEHCPRSRMAEGDLVAISEGYSAYNFTVFNTCDEILQLSTRSEDRFGVCGLCEFDTVGVG